MEIGNLYSFVVLLVLVGMVIGVGVLALDKFSQSSGITTATSEALNASIEEVGAVATTWLGLIVTIAILAIIIGLVVRGFAGGKR